MASGNAAGEAVRDVEEGAVAIGDARIERQQLRVEGPTLDALVKMHGAPRPYAPVPEQPAADANPHEVLLPPHIEGNGQVMHDVIVVAGVQGNPLLRACSDDTLDHVERRVAVEGRDLD